MNQDYFYNNDILSILKKENIWIVEPKVRLDLSFSDNFYSKVMEILQLESQHLFIDMAQVPYISSSGIKVILKIKNFLEMRGYKFGLYNLTKEVHKIIHISELHHLIPVFNNFDEALSYLKK
jgi:anti-sigma B factor antagonist